MTHCGHGCPELGLSTSPRWTGSAVPRCHVGVHGGPGCGPCGSRGRRLPGLQASALLLFVTQGSFCFLCDCLAVRHAELGGAEPRGHLHRGIRLQVRDRASKTLETALPWATAPPCVSRRSWSRLRPSLQLTLPAPTPQLRVLVSSQLQHMGARTPLTDRGSALC